MLFFNVTYLNTRTKMAYESRFGCWYPNIITLEVWRMLTRPLDYYIFSFFFIEI